MLVRFGLQQMWGTFNTPLQMLLNYHPHHPWPLAVPAGTDGSCSQPTSGGPPGLDHTLHGRKEEYYRNSHKLQIKQMHPHQLLGSTTWHMQCICKAIRIWCSPRKNELIPILQIGKLRQRSQVGCQSSSSWPTSHTLFPWLNIISTPLTGP